MSVSPVRDGDAYPGELEPLPRRRGGPPVTADEALGTARRMAREQAKRRGVDPELPDALPFPEQSGTTPLVSVRVPPRTLWFAHAKADMEGRNLSAAIREFIETYGACPPGSVLRFDPPPKVKAKPAPEPDAGPEQTVGDPDAEAAVPAELES